MTEEDKPRRPNEKYKLSRGEGFDPENEKLVFYYNRERRLEKASQNVKDLYKEKKPSRFNLLRPLIADKPRAIIFSTILVLCAFIFMFSLLGYFDSSYSLEGNKIEIYGSRYEGTTLIILKKGIEGKTPYTGAVDIAVSVPVQPDEEMRVFYHRVYFTLDKEEVYRFVVPFDSPDLLMVLVTEKSNLQIKFKPE